MVPAGEAYVPVEGPRGEQGFFRVLPTGRIARGASSRRAPSLLACQALERMIRRRAHCRRHRRHRLHRRRHGGRGPVSFHPKMAYGATFHKSSRQLEDEGPVSNTPPRTGRALTSSSSAIRRIGAAPRCCLRLYLVQYQQGYITANAIRHVAELLGITRADVEDVVSFYTMFYTRPVGKFVLQVCRTLSCALNGAERVTEGLMDKLSIKPGETDPTGTFTLLEVECLGACDRAPVVMVNDAWHECQKPEDAARLVDDLRARGEAALSGCHHVIERRN